MNGYTPVDPAVTLGCFNVDRSTLDGCYFNLMMAAGRGSYYLSCSADGQTVDLWSQDDNSGRQRWEILPNGVTSSSGLVLCFIRVLCGENSERRYFGVDTDPDPQFPNGRIQLVPRRLAANFVFYQGGSSENELAIGWYDPPGEQFYAALGAHNCIGLATEPAPWTIRRIAR